MVGGGGSSSETKIAEGIRDAKNRRFVLYIAFAGKRGGLQPPGSATHVKPNVSEKMMHYKLQVVAGAHAYKKSPYVLPIKVFFYI